MRNHVEKQANHEAVVLKTGAELAEKFHQQISMTEQTIERAKQHFEVRKGDFETGLHGDIRQAQQQYHQYRNHADPSTLAELKRLVLAIKSNAGMVDKLVITELASLLFELLDDGFDTVNTRVRDSIGLYLQTLEELMDGVIIATEPEQIDTLVARFRTLNQKIR
jgi:hypothetical protein